MAKPGGRCGWQWAYHGTHCSGISNAVTNNGEGISSITWKLTLMPLCIAGFSGWETYAYNGMIYAAENGADIVSNSWSGNPYSIANQEAVNYAAGLGIIIVAGAGNENNNVLFYPASYQNVVSVASVNIDDTRTFYSNFNYKVDIATPGGGTEGGILSTMPDDQYGLEMGTSMATPLAAGCLGLLKSYHPDGSNDQLIT